MPLIPEVPVSVLSRHAAGDVLAFRLVGMDDRQAEEGAPALGIAAHDASSGDMMAVKILGLLHVEAGAVLASGTPLASDANGRAVALSSLTGSPERIGFALDAAVGPGSVIPVLVR